MAEFKPLYEGNNFYCPLCDKYHEINPHLKKVISDEKVLWIANMTTHYRWRHTDWNNRWKDKAAEYPYIYATKIYKKYKNKEAELNKRKIVRKCFEFLRHHAIDASHFQRSGSKHPMTLRAAVNFLGGKVRIKPKNAIHKGKNKLQRGSSGLHR